MIWTNNLDPILFAAGPLEVRWYGFLFALGILSYYLVIQWIFKKEKYSLKHLDSLILYMFFGLVIGARLGHVFFYNAGYYLENPVDILKIWNGGLASHGAAIGLLVAYSLWCWRNKTKFSKYVDAIAFPMALAAGFVRVGNFFNSEIVGRATDSDYGVVFARLGEDFPRHPSQFYEAGLTWIVFVILLVVYKKYYKKTPPMFLMFLYVLMYFSTRFLVEFWKERHVLSYDIPLSMGQILSILPVLIAVIYFVAWYPRHRKPRSS